MKQKDKTMNKNFNNMFKPGTLILRYYKSRYIINYIVLKIFVKNNAKLCKCLCNHTYSDSVAVHEFWIEYDFQSIQGLNINLSNQRT